MLIQHPPVECGGGGRRAGRLEVHFAQFLIRGLCNGSLAEQNSRRRHESW
jgi:hypothetical protein